MVFVCDNCGFIFSRTAEPEQCPDCGKSLVRPANEIEQEEFAARMSTPRWDGFPVDFRPQDVVLEETNAFRFQMPVSVLGIDSRQIIEIMVEHGISSWDPNVIAANAWAKLVGAKFAETVLTVQIPLRQSEAGSERMKRIFEALIEHDLFDEKLREFVIRLIENE